MKLCAVQEFWFEVYCFAFFPNRKIYSTSLSEAIFIQFIESFQETRDKNEVKTVFKSSYCFLNWYHKMLYQPLKITYFVLMPSTTLLKGQCHEMFAPLFYCLKPSGSLMNRLNCKLFSFWKDIRLQSLKFMCPQSTIIRTRNFSLR